MKKRGKRKCKICVYCGSNRLATRDHVVPLCLFLSPYPQNLITVTACDDCAEEKSKDDDFLRDFLVCDNWATPHPTAQTIFHTKTLKSQRRNSSVIAKEAVKNAVLQPLHTSGGIYISDFHMVTVDEQRLIRVFERLVQGLYYDSEKRLFPTGYSLEVNRFFPWQFRELFEPLSKYNPRRRVMGDVFACAFVASNEDPFSTLWLFRFYEQVMFSVCTSKPELRC